MLLDPRKERTSCPVACSLNMGGNLPRPWEKIAHVHHHCKALPATHAGGMFTDVTIKEAARCYIEVGSSG